MLTNLDEPDTRNALWVRPQRRRAVTTEVTVDGLARVGFGIFVALGTALDDLDLVCA
jgi:hypothetical protein